MRDFNPYALARKHVLSLEPYASARDEFRGQASLQLDANESPFPSSYNRYPDSKQLRVRKAIAGVIGISERELLLTHGSDEAIDLLIRAFCIPGSDNIIVTNPTYGMYEVCAGINEVSVRKVDLDGGFDLDIDAVLRTINGKTKLIFICSPNNPTGNVISLNRIKKLLKTFAGFIVVDEAYVDFTGTAGWAAEIKKYKQLVVLRTFSKAWGLAGLRAGVCIGHKQVIEILGKIKPPYNIGTVVERVLIPEITRNRASVARRAQTIIQERQKLASQLNKVPVVVQVYPSDSNFLLIRVRRAAKTYEQLLDLGVVVRLRRDLPHAGDCLRITVGTPAQNKKLLKVLKTL